MYHEEGLSDSRVNKFQSSLNSQQIQHSWQPPPSTLKPSNIDKIVNSKSIYITRCKTNAEPF